MGDCATNVALVSCTMAMKKILFVMEELQMNGASKSLIALLEALRGQAYDISLFLFSHDGELTKDVPSYVKILPQSFPYWISRAFSKQAIVGALKRGRIDLAIWRIVVGLARHFHWNFPGWFMLPRVEGKWDVACAYCDGLIAPTLLRKVSAVRKFSWIHCDYTKYPQHKETYEALEKMDGIVAVSKKALEQFDQAMAPRKARQRYVIHNIIDAEECRRKAGTGKSENIVRPKIVTVGRLSEEKGMGLIPAIASKIRRDFEWVVVGSGPLECGMRGESARLNLVDQVRLIGALDNPMPEVASADIVVIPSKSEAWGMTLSEALVLGKPVVATDLPVFREQVTDGVNGLLCPLDDTDAFAAAINRLMRDENLRNRLSAEAVKYPFTKERAVAEFAAVIEDVSK